MRGNSNLSLTCITYTYIKHNVLIHWYCRPLHELETLWFKDGILIENSGVSYNLNDPWNRTLGLLSANLTHTGKYTCKVKMRTGGYSTISASAKIVVHEKPSFIHHLKTETLGDYGAMVSIPCDTIGMPVPNVTWFKNTKQVVGDFAGR